MNSAEGVGPAVFVILAFIIVPVLYFVAKAQKQASKLYVRRIAGIDAIDEAVGRSAELGRPISYTFGLIGVSPVLYASLGVLSYIAKKAANYSTPLLLAQNQPEVMAISDEVVREAYQSQGRLGSWDSRNNIFLSEEQFAYAAGYMGLMQREKVGSAFLFGYFAAESLILAEAGQQVGAMQVAASVSPEQVAFFIAACDYTLIGEELYATSAYLSREPIQLGSLCGQDRAKLFFFIIILLGTIIASLNSIFPELKLIGLDQIMNYSFADWYEIFGL